MTYARVVMTPRQAFSLISSFVLLVAPACDSDGGKGAAADGGGAADGSAPAKSGEAEAKADDKDSAAAGAGEPAKAEPPAEPCKALVGATQTACRHQLHTGAETGCLMALMGIKTAAEQAGGQLFDLGPDNQKAADANCGIHLDKVLEKYEAVKDAPKVSWGPECTKYVAQYDETCLATLGQKDRDASCNDPFNGVMAPLRPDNVDGAELGCGMAMRMKG